MAQLFGVSIDRLYGFHLGSYSDEVKAILKQADNSRDTYKEIGILSDGLTRYPNSPELKISLAFSLSMVNRMSKDEAERRAAVEKAICLCDEVVSTCGDEKQIDDALHMLWRIYAETGEFEKALSAIDKLSAGNFYARIVGTAGVYYQKKDYEGQARYTEKALFECWLAMNQILEIRVGAMIAQGEYAGALSLYDAYRKLLSVFDDGCADFYATHKIWACERAACAAMKLGDRERCLVQLRLFGELAGQVRDVAKSADFDVSVRNPLYFSRLEKDSAMEEYMTDVYPEKMLRTYDKFFGEDKEYRALKQQICG